MASYLNHNSPVQGYFVMVQEPVQSMHVKFFNLRDYMESETVMDPPGAKSVLTEWQNGQEKLNSRRLELVNSLR